MKVIVTKNFDESCKLVATRIAEIVKAKPDAKLGLATGGTCENIYAQLIKLYKEENIDFSNVRTVNLDEYVGMDPANELSYRYYMNHHLFDHINIKKENTYVANGLIDAETMVKEFREKLKELEPCDFQLLGIGVSGHVGFNEAGEKLHPYAHVENLDISTIEANSRYFEDKTKVPRQAVTMGMKDISDAREVYLIASGASKVNAIKGLVADPYITTSNPSTLLKLHNNFTVVIDKELADLVGIEY